MCNSCKSIYVWKILWICTIFLKVSPNDLVYIKIIIRISYIEQLSIAVIKENHIRLFLAFRKNEDEGGLKISLKYSS